MKLSLIIKQLRQYCPVFEGRIAGAAEFSGLTENTSMKTPTAYVIPLDESAGEERGATGYRQEVHASFGVVVVCSARKDERGQTAIESVDDIRDDLFKALLLWEPDGKQSEITFEGGRLLHLDRSRIFYQFEFGYDYQINSEDTWMAIRDVNLEPFKTLDLDVHGIDGNPEAETVVHAQFNHLNE